MRALCSVRGPLGGETRALGAGARFLALRLPSQTQPLHFVVEAKAKVKDLRALVNAHAQLQGMTDTGLFGLAVMQNGEYWFIEEDSKLSKFAPKSWRSSHTHGLDANGKPLLELYLVVQFYIESPLLIRDDVGRNLYYLQLRLNMKVRDALPAEALLLLTGLALQAEHGDADGYENRDYFNVEDYAPSSLVGDWVASAMRACHREHKGLTKEEAELRFIREMCLIPDIINSHRYRLKQTKAEPEPGTVWLLVTAKGIKILPDNGSTSCFIWNSIGKLSFDRKKFEIKSEEGKVTLYSSSEDKCKYIFSLCKDTHQFSLKIASKVSEILAKEDQDNKSHYGFAQYLNINFNQNKNEQRISLISTTSSNTTSGIVSDRVQSEDELEIMIDTPPAPSTESLAFAHLLDFTNSYLVNRTEPLSKSTSFNIKKGNNAHKIKNDTNKLKKCESSIDIQESTHQDQNGILENHDSIASGVSNKLKCAGSQCSSSCSTVIMARAGLSTVSRTSDASSLELGFSHTAQNSVLSDNSLCALDSEYAQDTASALYDGLGQPATIAASSETSGVYTMGSSEITTTTKSNTESGICGSSFVKTDFKRFNVIKDDFEDFDSVSSILQNKSELTRSSLYPSNSIIGTDCVDGPRILKIQNNTDQDPFRQRRNSDLSVTSFHGDGSDPTDSKHDLLSATELTDLIVGRGVYPKGHSVSDTMDSVSDYVRLPFSGNDYLSQNNAQSDISYSDNAFFDRPPTPPTRTDSRKILNLSLPNILDIDVMPTDLPKFPDKPPPPYEFNHKTVSNECLLNIPPTTYPRTIFNKNEEVTARVVTSKPMITILKAEAGEVSSSSGRTFASPMVPEHRFQKSKKVIPSSHRADRSKLAQSNSSQNSISALDSATNKPENNVFVAMMRLPQPKPPLPASTRRPRPPPPPPVSRLPPPPPPQNQRFHQQLYSDVDYVYYPLQDPAISQQNYLEHRLAENRMVNLNKTNLQYRSTPFLSANSSTSPVYGSIQNLSDTYVQLPGTRTSLYSITSKTSSASNHSLHFDRGQMTPQQYERSTCLRTKSDENVLNLCDPLPRRMRRVPPPPPPPYEHKKKLPAPVRDMDVNHQPNSVVTSELNISKSRDANCDLDIKSLREKSKNLDLPLISALCNDKSLLKQTKAFGSPTNQQLKGEPENIRKETSKLLKGGNDTLELKLKQDHTNKHIGQGAIKKIIIRNPTDKLPALPSAGAHTPRAMSNMYVIHPNVAVSKRLHPSS